MSDIKNDPKYQIFREAVCGIIQEEVERLKREEQEQEKSTPKKEEKKDESEKSFFDSLFSA